MAIRPVFLALSALTLSGCILVEGQGAATVFTLQGASQYNHRGMVNSERTVLQGRGEIGLATKGGGTLGLNIFGNMETSNSIGNAWFPDGQAGKFSEIDLTALYSHPLGPVTATVGVQSYVLPDGEKFPLAGPRDSSTELFARGEMTIFGFIPSLQANFDVDEADGHYLRAALLREVDLFGPFFIELKGGIGYSDKDQSDWTYGIDESGFSDARADATLLYQFDSRTAFFVGIAGVTIVDDDLRDWFDTIDVEKDNIIGFVGVEFDIRGPEADAEE